MSILLIEFNDSYFRDVAAALLNKNKKLPTTYIATIFPDLYLGRSEFSKITILDERHFHLSDYITDLNSSNPSSLSKKTIIENLEVESLYLSITDRLCFYPKTVNERKQRYYELLQYWDHFLDTKKITAIIFPRVPHLGYGNIVYYLAKKKGINVVILRETLLDDRLLITSGYNDFKKVPASFLKNLTLSELQKKLATQTEIVLEKKTQLMEINHADNSIASQKNTQASWQSLFDLTTFKAALTMLHNPFDRFVGTPTFMEPPTSWFEYYVMIFKYYLRYREILEFYTKVSQPVPLNKNYIYFALHYQPERTSMPEGDVFENQHLMIDILSKSLPKGWFLYVKEHPFQFTRTDIRKMNFRVPAFYRRILRYKNVKLVSLETNSKELIQNCQAAVTLTGSTGWEALVNQKPVITFAASAWYSPCNSCYIVTSQAECKAAIDQIIATKKPSVLKHLLQYLLYYDQKFVLTSSSVELAEISKRPYHSLVNNLATAIINKL